MSLRNQFEMEEVKGCARTMIMIFLESEQTLRNIDGNYDLNLCSEFIDGCHVLLSVASLTSSSLFDNLLKSIRLVIEHFFLVIFYKAAHCKFNDYLLYQ